MVRRALVFEVDSRRKKGSTKSTWKKNGENRSKKVDLTRKM